MCRTLENCWFSRNQVINSLACLLLGLLVLLFHSTQYVALLIAALGKILTLSKDKIIQAASDAEMYFAS